MAVEATPPTRAPAGYDGYAEEERGYGWVLFAGTLLLMLGTLNFIEWIGVLVLGVNSIVQLMMIPAYPFWSLSIFALDILAIYGLVAYGARISRGETKLRVPRAEPRFVPSVAP